MKRTNVNSRYVRDKILAKELGMRYVPFSGSRVESEDAVDDLRMAQCKSSKGKSVTVVYEDLAQLVSHAGVRLPIFVLDFESPKIGTTEFPEEAWVAMPLADYKKIFAVYRTMLERREALYPKNLLQDD